MDRRSLVRYAWLSIAVALLTLAMKGAAYVLTGSIGFMSDAIESLVNVVGAVMALSMLTVAARPPDDEHRYGHEKAEYFSSFFEGSLIFAAAVGIGIAAVARLVQPRALEQIGLGLVVSIGAEASRDRGSFASRAAATVASPTGITRRAA